MPGSGATGQRRSGHLRGEASCTAGTRALSRAGYPDRCPQASRVVDVMEQVVRQIGP